MNRLRDSYFTYARYCNSDFIFIKNNEDKTTQWMLYSSLCYRTNAKARELKFIKLSISYRNPEEAYYLPITPSQVECAYRIKNFCECQGDVLECLYDDEKQEFTFDMRGVNYRICEKHGLGNAWERYNISRGIEEMGMLLRIPDSEILNVWEIHEPIKDFPFKGPEKVWVKKDGVWLR